MPVDINTLKQTPNKVRIKKRLPEPAKIIEPEVSDVYNLKDEEILNNSNSNTKPLIDSFQFTDGESIETFIKKVDWKGFDVEQIVEFLVKLSVKLNDAPLFPYQECFQRAVFRSVLYNWGDSITYLVSRQSGKTTVTGFTIATLCVAMPALAKHFPEQLGVFKKGFKVGIYAPSVDQADTMYSRIKATSLSAEAMAVYSDPDINISVNQKGLSWSNGSMVYMKSSSVQSKVESKTFDLLVTDETQDIPKSVYESRLSPMVAWTNGTVIHLGTPSERPCFFYDTIESNKAEFLAGGRQTHFEFNALEVLKYNPRYKEHLKKQSRLLGEDSVAFRKSYMLEWVFQKENPFIFSKIKDYIFQKKYGLVWKTSAPVICGLDYGKDRSKCILTVGTPVDIEIQDEVTNEVYKKKGLQVLNWFHIDFKRSIEQRKEIYRILSSYTNILTLVIDSTGKGDIVAEDMENEWDRGYLIERFIYSSSSKQQLSELFEGFLWNYQILIPHTPSSEHFKAFINELKFLKKEFFANYSYYANPGMDDYFDSLCLALHGLKNVRNKGGIEFADSIFLSKPKNGKSTLEEYRRWIRESRVLKELPIKKLKVRQVSKHDSFRVD